MIEMNKIRNEIGPNEAARSVSTDATAEDGPYEVVFVIRVDGVDRATWNAFDDAAKAFAARFLPKPKSSDGATP